MSGNETIDALIREKFLEILDEGRDAYWAKLHWEVSHESCEHYMSIVNQFVLFMKYGCRTARWGR